MKRGTRTATAPQVPPPPSTPEVLDEPVDPIVERRSYRFCGVVTALSSISHIGDTYGVNAKLRREKIIQPNGRVEQVPVFSGNATRGMLRDLGMGYMLNQIGSPKLTLAAFYFLFSGGSLTKIAGKAIDIAFARELQRLIPLIGIFGGAVGNQILPGRLQMGKLLPVCSETLHLLPEAALAGDYCPESIWEYLQEEAYTRRDDEKDERKRYHISASEQKLIEAKRVEKAAVVPDSEEDVDKEQGQHQQMRYYCETFSAGTRFWWEINLEDVTDLEFEAFLTCLLEFSRNPVIGGKGAIGHGRVAVKFDKWITIDPTLQTGEAIAVPLGAQYHAHLATERIAILGALARFQ